MTFMADKKSIKLTQISKDFNIKAKDVIDFFKDIGFEKKSGASAESEEYELFLHKLTATHQIKNIDDYIDGKTKISVISDKPAKEEPEKAEAKPAPAPEKKAEVKPAPTPEKKAEARPTPAPEKKEEVKAAPAPEKKAEVNATPTPEKKFNPQQNRDPRPEKRRDERDQRGERGQNQPRFQRYNDRPADDPFAKRRMDMNRAAEGFRKPGATPQ